MARIELSAKLSISLTTPYTFAPRPRCGCRCHRRAPPARLEQRHILRPRCAHFSLKNRDKSRANPARTVINSSQIKRKVLINRFFVGLALR